MNLYDNFFIDATLLFKILYLHVIIPEIYILGGYMLHDFDYGFDFSTNILEAGELVPMNYPPTARVAAYRRMENPNTEEIKDWLYELVDTLKKACRLV